MVSTHTEEELEQYLGQVPSFIEELADSTVDHSWGLMRDLELAETELSSREKALVGLGAASAIQCPYCVHFHEAELGLEDVTDEEIREAVNVAGTVRYFSTILHGASVDVDDFVEETSEIVQHVRDQQTAVGDD